MMDFPAPDLVGGQSFLKSEVIGEKKVEPN